ncbi:MAG TPA: HAMP domain-containing sensor histidine kinase [Candidatus Acidoferrales bacterium]|nr:HAMP domain-containing sensor histidine kinase [Candidatus Acidoferrales bacterium]
MHAQLFSQDRELYRLCREVLSEIAGDDWNLTVVSAEQVSEDSDLSLWDCHPDVPLPDCVFTSPSKHLFLVDRKDLARFREQTGADDGHILLKPVSRATLSAFLASSGRNDHLSSAQSLRADRDEILQCLIQANLRLQEYDQDRTTFLARAVHDFRAPLTALSGYCGLLLSEPLGPLTQSQREVLQRMQHSAKRLSRMAAAMFQLSVGRHVKRRPDLQHGDIRDCLEQALHEITPFAEDKSIAINTDVVAPEQPLFFEAGQIEQVLVNILDNACKFTPKAGTIDVRCYPYFWERRLTRSAIPPGAERRHRVRYDPNAYRIDIRDSGCPVPPEHLNDIFEEYTSYAGGRDRSGGGLGLAITRMIVNQHEGTVWAENTDQGPMFSVVLPM